jgi:L-lactate utilization protein LutC
LCCTRVDPSEDQSIKHSALGGVRGARSFLSESGLLMIQCSEQIGRIVPAIYYIAAS